MTKEEVYNNIRYNENKVRMYINTIRQLDNQIDTLRKQINYLNEEIYNLNRQINNLEKQICELNQLKDKYYRLQENLQNKQMIRKRELNSIFSYINKVRFIASYANGMKDLLSGWEYKRVYNGLSEALEIIERKIHMIHNNVDYVNRDIRNKQHSIDERRYDIRCYEQERDDANYNLSYRKRRIDYWQNQLQYAT